MIDELRLGRFLEDMPSTAASFACGRTSITGGSGLNSLAASCSVASTFVAGRLCCRAFACPVWTASAMFAINPSTPSASSGSVLLLFSKLLLLCSSRIFPIAALDVAVLLTLHHWSTFLSGLRFVSFRFVSYRHPYPVPFSHRLSSLNLRSFPFFCSSSSLSFGSSRLGWDRPTPFRTKGPKPPRMQMGWNGTCSNGFPSFHRKPIRVSLMEEGRRGSIPIEGVDGATNTRRHDRKTHQPRHTCNQTPCSDGKVEPTYKG